MEEGYSTCRKIWGGGEICLGFRKSREEAGSSSWSVGERRVAERQNGSRRLYTFSKKKEEAPRTEKVVLLGNRRA